MRGSAIREFRRLFSRIFFFGLLSCNPPNASATVDGRTRNGGGVTEFGLTVRGGETKTVSRRIGWGASKSILSAKNGDLRIKKGSTTPPAPETPAPAAPPVTQ
ncbi:MAG: hypothetical protein ABSC48_04890 [Terracidiphilus sp.]|jgi:hypothetical protein